MGNGQWAMGNGQWAMGNGQWAMGNGQWAMGNGQGESPCDYVIRAQQLYMDLNNIMMRINSCHDVDEILLGVVEESCKALGCELA
jgi:hypothetical protein